MIVIMIIFETAIKKSTQSNCINVADFAVLKFLIIHYMCLVAVYFK